MRKLNKKGFTLVELIVVIAIIAVLAAILVPMMLGYISSSRIASVNTAAGRIRDSVTYFMTQAGCDGYGMFLSQNAISDVDIDIQNGNWHVVMSDSTVFLDRYDALWDSPDGTANAADDESMMFSLNAKNRLAYHLARTFSEIQYGFVRFRLVGGICTALYYTNAQNTAIDDFPAFGDYRGWADNSYAWAGGEQGVFDNGIIVGTSPVLMAN